MKLYKFLIFTIIISILLFILISYSNNNDNTDNISGTRTSTIINENKESTNLNNSTTPPKPKEEEISSFSTKILDDSPGRLTNISITCSIINDTIIHNGETFSFNDIVGEPTTDRGYQEAKVIIHHKAEKGIGVGNCQVSSTIYNAVLNIPSLTIIERNDHGGKNVGYVPIRKRCCCLLSVL